MILRKVHQNSPSELATFYDAVVCASGYESRARFIATQLAEKHVRIANRYVFAFKEHNTDCARPENDRRFHELHYKPVLCSGSSTEEAKRCFESILLPIKDVRSPKLLVDISCMTRAWYGVFVHSLLTLSRHDNVTVHFAYAVAEFKAPAKEYPPNRVAGPVPGFLGIALPDKPTALGIGLGYHADRALGLKDYLDPKVTVLLCPNPSLHPKYVESVRATNNQILNEVSVSNVIDYPVSDGVATFGILNSLCEGLMRNSRVVLCSFGPKIFGLCCFLVAAMRRDISIWRVGADDLEQPVDHKPSGTWLVLETVWGKEPV